MKQILRWTAIVVGGFAGLAVLGAAVAFGASEVMVRLPGPKEVDMVQASVGAEAIERGRHLAIVYGCHDCHGADLRGRLFHEEPPIVTISGPNLTLAAAAQTDGELARAIRKGVGADGRALWVMPSDAYAHFSDEETADLIAYVRSFSPGGEPMRIRKLGPVGRIGVLAGQLKSAPANLAAAPDLSPADLGPELAQGRALARACMECHNRDLSGVAFLGAPDLMIAGAYDAEDFERLLRTGIAPGERKLGLMSEVSPLRFDAWSSEEIAALHSYLRARADAAS